LIFANQYIQERIKKTQKLREEGINPYPNKITQGTNNKMKQKPTHLRVDSNLSVSWAKPLLHRLKIALA